jgi:hypothetical protein
MNKHNYNTIILGDYSWLNVCFFVYVVDNKQPIHVKKNNRKQNYFMCAKLVNYLL